MKKSLILIFAALCVFIYSCGGNGPSVSSYSGEESGYASYESEEYSEATSENQSEIKGEEAEEFLAEAESLLEKDREVTELIILGGIYKEENCEKGRVTLYPLSAENEYQSYSVLEELVRTVYTDAGSEYVLNYPPYGTDTVKDVSGETWFSTLYVPDYDDYALIQTAKVVYFKDGKGGVAVTTNNGLKVTVAFTQTSDGWRMDECLFKAVTGLKNASFDRSKYTATAMEQGSARTLSGSCLVINVFLNDQVSEWDDTDVDDVLAKMDSACAFMERSAAGYGVSLDVVSTDKAKSLYLETTEKLPTDINDFVWIDLLFADTVYRTLQGYAENYFDLDSYDNWCVMFHLNKKGRSYAIPCDTANSDWANYSAERCVIFHTDDDSYSYYDSPGVYVHELFHLFGAVDLYNPYITDEDDGVLKIYFPNDIMRMIPTNAELASVSPYTAFKLGWVGYIDEQFLFLAE